MSTSANREAYDRSTDDHNIYDCRDGGAIRGNNSRDYGDVDFISNSE